MGIMVSQALGLTHSGSCLLGAGGDLDGQLDTALQGNPGSSGPQAPPTAHPHC